jgi:heptosyltransferase-2
MPSTQNKSSAENPSPPFKAQRILVMRYRFIGDTILTVPFLRNLRYAAPHAKIDVLVGPQSGQVLKGCPYVDNLIEFDTTRFHKYDTGEGKKKSFLNYAFQLRKEKYDTAFVLKRSLSSAFLSLCIGAKQRIGYSAKGRDFLLTKTAPFNQSIHEVESTLDVLRCADIPIVDKHLEAWISDEERAGLLEIAPELKGQNRLVLIHAAAAHPDKIYPIESWAEIVRSLNHNWGLTPVFSGSATDKELYENLEFLANVSCLNYAGRLSLRQSMALYERVDLSICVDSGPAHLSAAVGTPTVALFGPTDPVRWRPWGEKHLAIYNDALPCRPCNYKKTCNNRECLTELSPKQVLTDVAKMLATRQSTG